MKSARFFLMPLIAGLALAAVLLAPPPSPALDAPVPQADVFVAPSGSDSNAGTQDAPFATINKALSVAKSGQTIAVQSGDYGPIVPSKKWDAAVRVLGYGATKPKIRPSEPTKEAVSIQNTEHLTLENLHLAGVTLLTNGARHITLRGCEMTDAWVGVRIQKSSDVLVTGCHIHPGGKYGLRGVPPWPANPSSESNRISIVNNDIEGLTDTAIEFGGWNDVLIEGNTIHDMHDPAKKNHNDGIQFTGSSNKVKIVGNTIHHSSAQLIFIQPAFGPIHDVLIQNNLAYQCGARAFSSSGATGVRILNNTIAQAKDGGIYLDRCHMKTNGKQMDFPAATDTIVANNVVMATNYSFLKQNGAAPAFEDFNFFAQPRDATGAHNIIGSDPKFLTPAEGHFQPAPGSPLLKKGTPLYAPATDRNGIARSKDAPTMGAFETPASS